MLRNMCILAVVLLPCLAQCFTPIAEESVMLVVPSRQLTVRCAFDIARLYPLQLVAYSTPRKRSAVPDLFVWRKAEKRWDKISVEDYRAGSFLEQQPTRVFIFGTDRYLRSAIVEASGRRWRTKRIASMNLGDLVNTMHGEFHFSPSEWRWLAKRNGLVLKDRNEERRRYGRYGPPGQKPRLPVVPPKEPVVEPAPAPEVEQPARQPRLSTVLELVPEPEAVPEPEPVVKPEPEPAPVAEPKVAPKPVPAPEPKPEPAPKAPESEQKPKPELKPPPDPEPEVEAEPKPGKKPAARKWQELPQVDDLEETMPKGVRSVGDSIRRELEPVAAEDK